MRIILTAFIGVIGVTSCNRTIPCANQYITRVFIGYKTSELDTLIIRTYKKDDNFLTLLDTIVYLPGDRLLTIGTSNDTTSIGLNPTGVENILCLTMIGRYIYQQPIRPF